MRKRRRSFPAEGRKDAKREKTGGKHIEKGLDIGRAKGGKEGGKKKGGPATKGRHILTLGKGKKGEEKKVIVEKERTGAGTHVNTAKIRRVPRRKKT